jgi:hypothetical protein
MLRFRNFGKIFDSICLRYKRAFVIKYICTLQQFNFEERLTTPLPSPFGFNLLTLVILSEEAIMEGKSDKGNIYFSKIRRNMTFTKLNTRKLENLSNSYTGGQYMKSEVIAVVIVV